jgi:DHA1 family bicyclomycin/chloramphenicol resistance-like MFS transporter
MRERGSHASQGPARQIRMSRAFLIPFCGLLLMLNAFSCDIMLPAFWSLQTSFGVAIEKAQSVVPVFLMSAGIGQLFAGPLSDRFGRRPVVIAGLLLYLAGLGIGFIAPSIDVLLVGRALQGFGSAFGIVVGRAILRDTNSGAELARTMALSFAIFSGGPILAPLLGYGLSTAGGWRAVYGGMVVFGLAVLTAALLKLEESNRSLNPRALEPVALAGAVRRVFAHPQSRYFLMIAGILTFAITSFVTNAPRLFKSAFGIEGFSFALLFATTALGIIIGQLGNNRIIARVGVIATTRVAASVIATVAGVMLLLSYFEVLGIVGFLALMFVFNTCFLVVLSNCASLVIDPHHEVAGVASSLYGFICQIVASTLVLITLPLYQGRLVAWATGTFLTTSIVLAALLLYRPRAIAATAKI